MPWITEHIQVPDSELRWEFTRSAGPGGQNVNKLSTAVRLRFDVRTSPSLPGAVKHRIARLAGGRMTADGILLIEARRQRTQAGNRREALERFCNLLRRAATPAPIRRQTRPPASAVRRRIEAKLHRSRLKARRRPPRPDD
ncbi:MAG: aminoacyl-tRNA hydrolase [Kiritimatiellaeota bacterium]|nr:aminoacyl-tRNA hydrolase [Kiritimatiellota bacterium]